MSQDVLSRCAADDDDDVMSALLLQRAEGMLGEGGGAYHTVVGKCVVQMRCIMKSRSKKGFRDVTIHKQLAGSPDGQSRCLQLWSPNG